MGRTCNSEIILWGHLMVDSRMEGRNTGAYVLTSTLSKKGRGSREYVGLFSHIKVSSVSP